MKKLIVTGSSGLIGSAVAEFFHQRGWEIFGADNNMRADFFGLEGDTSWNLQRLGRELKNFNHQSLDIRQRDAVLKFIAEVKPDAIVHCAAQPSHDLAAKRPFDDFDVNAGGTLNLLEATRRVSTGIIFVHMSTNKVYGDAPNRIALRELPTRWDYDDAAFEDGIAETMSIDQSKHSLFGASKAAADILVQEYGRYFGMSVCCLRCGCLTGPQHSGVELHGFLSYLVKCNLEGRMYNIYGYKGKQVRDNIHSADVAEFIHRFIQAPRVAEVYNLGGGRANSCSLLEAFQQVEAITGMSRKTTYQDTPRQGDHICYISDLSRIKAHFPGWEVARSLPEILRECAGAWRQRLAS
ncbi:MAG TPA: NAD-dependent epimerase/dehydratase family protein [Candidatus Saccharimonadales bacterium]|nr:NAD-dependent epimerase/dehydratase family protein [Candidatus Saccharimonadales bacterium]